MAKSKRWGITNNNWQTFNDKNFSTAFSNALKAGLEGFNWRGLSYTTKNRGELDYIWDQNLKKYISPTLSAQKPIETVGTLNITSGSNPNTYTPAGSTTPILLNVTTLQTPTLLIDYITNGTANAGNLNSNYLKSLGIGNVNQLYDYITNAKNKDNIVTRFFLQYDPSMFTPSTKAYNSVDYNNEMSLKRLNFINLMNLNGIRGKFGNRDSGRLNNFFTNLLNTRTNYINTVSNWRDKYGLLFGYNPATLQYSTPESGSDQNRTNALVDLKSQLSDYFTPGQNINTYIPYVKDNKEGNNWLLNNGFELGADNYWHIKFKNGGVMRKFQDGGLINILQQVGNLLLGDDAPDASTEDGQQLIMDAVKYQYLVDQGVENPTEDDINNVDDDAVSLYFQDTILPELLNQQLAPLTQEVPEQEQENMISAKLGAKLNYINRLRGVVPEGYEAVYMKCGGQVVKRIKKKALKDCNGAKVKKACGGISAKINAFKAEHGGHVLSTSFGDCDYRPGKVHPGQGRSKFNAKGTLKTKKSTKNNFTSFGDTGKKKPTNVGLVGHTPKFGGRGPVESNANNKHTSFGSQIAAYHRGSTGNLRSGLRNSGGPKGLRARSGIFTVKKTN